LASGEAGGVVARVGAPARRCRAARAALSRSVLTRGGAARPVRFGLLCSAQAGRGDLHPETGQGFRDYLDFNVEAEELGFHSSFLVEHHFTDWN
jgi:hypothetical protein